MVAAALLLLFPVAAVSPGAIDWPLAWQSLLEKPGKLFVPIFYLLIVLPVTIASQKRLRNARLILDDRTLRYQSGLPFVSRWLDWSLDLNAIRSQQLAFRVVVLPGGSLSPQLYTVAWGASKHSGDRSNHTLRPGDWHLANQTSVAPKRSFLALPTKPSAQAAARLQAELQALPLVQALEQRGIVLPPITTKPANVGLDLMAYARLRVAVYAFFALLALAGLLMVSVRHSYYFASPPLEVWLAFGAVAWACTLAWLWAETTADQESGSGPHAETEPAKGLRATQLIVAAFVGLACGLCAPSLPLAYADLLQTPEARLFALQKHPLQLVVTDRANTTPPIQLEQATEYWQSLRAGSAIVLPVREGVSGLWWQYDATAVREKWIVFYANEP